MKGILLFITFLATFHVMLPSHHVGEAQVRMIVRNLGAEDSPDVYRQLDTLAQDPTLSIRLLISQLSVIKDAIEIPPEMYRKHPRALHVIWCIRALRYLTSIDFKARTSYKFPRSQETRQSLLTVRGGKLTFFVVRMEHNVVFLAPEDVQRQVIALWKKWYLKNGHHIEAHIQQDFNKWYF